MNISFTEAKFNLLVCYKKQGKRQKAQALFEELSR